MSATEGWVQCPLENLSSFIKDGSHGTHKDVDDGLPLLSAKDVRDGILTIPNDCRRISKTEYALIHKNYEIEPNDILLTIVGTIGRCYLMRESEPRFSIQRSVAVIRPDRVIPEYLYHFLRSDVFQTNLKDFTNASAQGGVYLGSVAKCIVKLPTSLFEQTKIAEILSAVDRAIKQTEALIAKQQRIKTGLMQDLLTRGIDEHGNLRTEQTHKFKDSPLGRIPVEWEIETLNNCVRVDAPICYGILMPGRGYDGGIPVIKVKDIIGGRIVQADILLTDPKIDAQYKRSRLRGDDLLLTIRGTTGRVASVPPELDGANITQDTARVRLKEELSNQFFYFLLQSFPLQDQIQLHTLGQAVKGINIGEVKRLFFALPNEDEQKAIAYRLRAFEQGIDSSKSDFVKLCALKTALMQDLLTGKKHVTPLLEMEPIH